MCLAASCGTIRKHSRVVSVEHGIQQVLSGGLVDVVLGGILVKDLVKAKALILDALPSGGNDGLGETLDGVVFRRIEDSETRCQYLWSF